MSDETPQEGPKSPGSDTAPAPVAADDSPETVSGQEAGSSSNAEKEAMGSSAAPAAATGPPAGAQEDHDSEEEDTAAGTGSAPDAAVDINGVPANDVKNIILQVLSPCFDDEGGEDDAQRYDHIKAHGWIQHICDGIMEKLLAMRRPYKYVVHCVIMRKSGAGIHLCSSCYYGQADGWVNHAHDLSAHVYAVVSVYWSVI
ncbi:dynein light chain Tctex-type, putative [Trypanosoma equiperdum]|uniref:Dynein light chain, putative n=2 Tax=Trypanozoon TaxID=39700 RepID=Q388R0_TRYB2|nr:dynein light chain, putative [Trypanosoma brucei brucei TREU927]EAN78710.1 dynein light chain, putative [Trypanosoma brucei brucei TREU927]SCU72646.1 dynein light chain Tctex-type, putative [Trypanosoma equiperdum]